MGQMAAVQSIKSFYDESCVKIETWKRATAPKTEKVKKAVDAVIHSVALKIFISALICLPFYYFFTNIFMLCLPLGIIFPHVIKEMDKRILTIVKNNLLVIVIAAPFIIKALPGTLIILTGYFAARLVSQVYLYSKEKAEKKVQAAKIKEIGLKSNPAPQSSIPPSRPTKLEALKNNIAPTAAKAKKVVHAIVNNVALKIFLNGLACLPFYYLFNNFFMLCLPIGVMFPNLTQKVDKRIMTIVKHNFAFIAIATLLFVKNLTGTLIILTGYFAIRFVSQLYLYGKEKANRKMETINLKDIVVVC
jgi:hypothetical protein